MSRDVCPVEKQQTKVRSAVSNGSKLRLFGDGRSAGARRYRDLINAFGDEAGGFDNLTVIGQQLVRRVAQVSVELEILEATRAQGQAIDPVAFVTLVNSQRRLMRDLERISAKKAAQEPRKPALAEYLAGRARDAQETTSEAA